MDNRITGGYVNIPLYIQTPPAAPMIAGYSNGSLWIDEVGNAIYARGSKSDGTLYQFLLGGGSGGVVLSFNGRTGAVVPSSGDYTTSIVAEGANLYFTQPRVLATPLTGFSTVNLPILATDTVLQAFGKAQGQLNSLVTGVSSFNTRTGAVVSQSGDYTAAMVTNAADKSSVSTQLFTGYINTPALILPAATSGHLATIASVATLGQNTALTIPDPGQSTAQFILNYSQSGSQTINGSLNIGGSLLVGTASMQEYLEIFPSAPNSGFMYIYAQNNVFNYDLGITMVANIGQPTEILIPDPGTGVANFILSSSVSGQIISNALSVTGKFSSPTLTATGITGAASTTRIVGANSSGAPTSGTFSQGDVATDYSGALWICTASGTPGTWVSSDGASYTFTNGIKNVSGAVQFDSTYSPTFVNLTLTGISNNGSITTPSSQFTIAGSAQLNLGATTQINLSSSGGSGQINLYGITNANGNVAIENSSLYITSSGSQLYVLEWNNTYNGMVTDSLNGSGGSSPLWMNPTGGYVGIGFAPSITLSNALQINGVISSGISSGTSAGNFIAYSATANLGSLQLLATNAGGNFNTIITNAAILQTSTITVPDPGAISANFLLDTGSGQLTPGSSLKFDKGTGTEASNIVTINNQAGVITSSSLSTTPLSSYVIRLNNSKISGNSVITLSYQGGTNSNLYFAFAIFPSNGFATLNIYNTSAALSFNGTFVIGFSIM